MSYIRSEEALTAILKILEEHKVALHPSAPFTDYGWGKLGSLFSMLGIDRDDLCDAVDMTSDFIIFEGKKFIRCTKTTNGCSWSIETAPVDMLLLKKEFLRMEDGNYVFKRNGDTIFIDIMNISKVS